MRTVLELVEVAQPIIEVDMPTGGVVVHVEPGASGAIGRLPTVAFFVDGDTDAKMAKRRFAVTFTGQEVPAGARHVGTFVAGPYVHHVFEVA